MNWKQVVRPLSFQVLALFMPIGSGVYRVLRIPGSHWMGVFGQLKHSHDHMCGLERSSKKLVFAYGLTLMQVQCLTVKLYSTFFCDFFSNFKFFHFPAVRNIPNLKKNRKRKKKFAWASSWQLKIRAIYIVGNNKKWVESWWQAFTRNKCHGKFVLVFYWLFLGKFLKS